jgi:molybdenum cofactor synthesis domain-containing protein
VKLLNVWAEKTGLNIETNLSLLPDDAEQLDKLLKKQSAKADIIITTGGTGIGPRDITVDVVKTHLQKEIPGIMEHIRVKYGISKPNALISRSVAGVSNNSLVFTLPGSLKAINEYMSEITPLLHHLILMKHGIDAH